MARCIIRTGCSLLGLLTLIPGCSEHRAEVGNQDVALASEAVKATTFKVEYWIDDVGIGPRATRLALANGDDQRIEVVDTLGQPMSRVGRKGDGPCEFRYLSSVAFLSDSIVVVTDRRDGVASICGINNRIADIVPIPGSDGRVYARTDSNFLFVGRTGVDSALSILVSWPNHELDTLSAISLSSSDSVFKQQRIRPPNLAPLRDGALLVGASDSTYRILSDETGSLRTLIDLPEPPAYRTPSELKESDQRLIRLLVKSGRPRVDYKSPLADTLKPKPRFRGAALAADDFGHLWAIPARRSGSEVIDVFDASTGEHLERLPLRTGLDGIHYGAGQLVGWSNNRATGVGTVYRWKVLTEPPYLGSAGGSRGN